MGFFARRYEISDKRLQICKECDKFDPSNSQCKVCGCFMNYKTLLPYVSCPLDKWKEVEDKEDK